MPSHFLDTRNGRALFMIMKVSAIAIETVFQ